MPFSIASVKLFFEVDVISMTLATDIPLSPWLREWLRRGTEQSEDRQDPFYRTRQRTIKRRTRAAPRRRR
jgi:hypothetical protein